MRTKLIETAPGLFDNSKTKQLWLVDGTALFHQSYHAPFQNLSVKCPVCITAESVKWLGESKVLCPYCSGTGRELANHSTMLYS